MEVEYLESRTLMTAGGLEKSFGDGGVLTMSTRDHFSPAHLTMQKDGKLLVSGIYDGAHANYFAVIRYTAGGKIDRTFGTSGMAISDVRLPSDQTLYALDDTPRCVASPDGRILLYGRVAGDEQNFTAFSMLKSSGAPDTYFGANGLHFDLTGLHGTNAKFLTTNRIVYGNSVLGTPFLITNSGETDWEPMSYDGGQISVDSQLTVLSVDHAGRYLMAGYSYDEADAVYRLTITRLRPDSESMDSAFGTSGVATSRTLGSDTQISSVYVDGNQEITAMTSSGADRFYNDGSIDLAFTHTSLHGFSSNKLIQQADGKFVSFRGTTLARFNAYGAFDVKFGINGKLTSKRSIVDAAVNAAGQIVALSTDNGKTTFTKFSSNVNSFAPPKAVSVVPSVRGFYKGNVSIDTVEGIKHSNASILAATLNVTSQTGGAIKGILTRGSPIGFSGSGSIKSDGTFEMRFGNGQDGPYLTLATFILKGTFKSGKITGKYTEFPSSSRFDGTFVLRRT